MTSGHDPSLRDGRGTGGAMRVPWLCVTFGHTGDGLRPSHGHGIDADLYPSLASLREAASL